jgi:hypothetical protein
MRDLFVCEEGYVRSKTAVWVSEELAFDKDIRDYQSDCFGIKNNCPSLNHVMKFDRVFVMSEEIAKLFSEKYGAYKGPIINLNVLDASLEEEHFRNLLRKELTEKLTPYFTREALSTLV